MDDIFLMRMKGFSFDRLVKLDLKVRSEIRCVREQLGSPTSTRASRKQKKKLKRLLRVQRAGRLTLQRYYPNELAASSPKKLAWPSGSRDCRPDPSGVVLAMDSDEEDLVTMMVSPSSDVVPCSQEDLPSSSQVLQSTTTSSQDDEESRTYMAPAGGEEFHLVRDGKELHLMGNGKEFRSIRKGRKEALPRVALDGEHGDDTGSRIVASTSQRQVPEEAKEGGEMNDAHHHLAALDLCDLGGAAHHSFEDDDDRSVISCTPPDDAYPAVVFKFPTVSKLPTRVKGGDQENEECEDREVDKVPVGMASSAPGREAVREQVGVIPVIKLDVMEHAAAERSGEQGERERAREKKRMGESGSDPALEMNSEVGSAETMKSRDDDAVRERKMEQVARTSGVSAEIKRKKKKRGNDEGTAYCSGSVIAAAEMKTKKKKKKSRENEEAAHQWNGSNGAAEMQSKKKRSRDAEEAATGYDKFSEMKSKKKSRNDEEEVGEKKNKEDKRGRDSLALSKPTADKKRKLHDSIDKEWTLEKPEKYSAAVTDENAMELSAVAGDDRKIMNEEEEGLKKEREKIKDELKRLKEEKKRLKREKKGMMEEEQTISQVSIDFNEKIKISHSTKENNSARGDEEAAQNEEGGGLPPARCFSSAISDLVTSPEMPFDKDLRVFEYEKQVAVVLQKHQPASREILKKYYQLSPFLRPSFRAILLTVHPLHRREALRRIETILPPSECFQRCMQAVQGTFDPASVSTSSSIASDEAHFVSSPTLAASALGPDVGLQISPAQQDTSKEKCRLFLSKLLALSNRELSKQKQELVRNLVQELIDSKLELKVFFEKLECYLSVKRRHFLSQKGNALEMGLPFLRKAMLDNEIDIGEGIRPPPPPTIEVLSTNAASNPRHLQCCCAPHMERAPGLAESMHWVWGELSGSQEGDWNAFRSAMTNF